MKIKRLLSIPGIGTILIGAVGAGVLYQYSDFSAALFIWIGAIVALLLIITGTK